MYTFVAISTVAEPPPAALTIKAELLTGKELDQCNGAEKQVWYARTTSSFVRVYTSRLANNAG